MKIENGGVSPSSQFINELTACLPKNQAEILIQIYCAETFPKFRYLFAEKMVMESEEAPSGITKSKASPQSGSQKELGPRQVHLIARTQIHYYLFLTLTLARTPVSIKELRLSSFLNKLSARKTMDALSDLVEAKVVRQIETDHFQAVALDVRFPPRSDSIGDLYGKMDAWDLDFGDAMDFSSVIRKSMIRRVSFRYMHLFLKQIDILFELIKASDELDPRFNNQVIQFIVSFKKGELPG